MMIVVSSQKYAWLFVCAVVFIISSSYWISNSYYRGNVSDTTDKSNQVLTTKANTIFNMEENSRAKMEVKKDNQIYEYEYARLILRENIENIKENRELQLLMRSLVEQLGDHDGLNTWRQQEAKHLTSAVQSAISRLQNPDDCTKAKKLVCHMTWGGCGFGCLVHHTTYCLITALATGRVLVLSDLPWPHSDLVIKNFFSPLSETCSNYTGATKVAWDVDPSDPTPTIEIHPNHYQQLIRNKQPYNPPAVHSGLAGRIFSLTSSPDAWWVGQFVGFLLRYNERVRVLLRQGEESIDFSSPVVGVHVRRTDKIGTPGGGFATAKAFEVEDYMEQVEMWFRMYEMSHGKVKRKIYIATDEAKILEECHLKFPEYTIYDNMEIAESAAKASRATEESLLGVIHDIHMLSLTDFVVCTHSSNICGLVYELLHFRHGHASNMMHSLDLPYSYYPYIYTTEFQALVDDPSSSLVRGDKLTTYNVERNFITQEGGEYVIQTENMRTGEQHSYLKYKLKQVPQLYNFTNFDLLDT